MLALVFLVALVGCARRAPLPGPDVLGRVGGQDVPYAAFSGYLRDSLGESEGGLESEALSGLLDQFLTERLVVRLAVDRQLVRVTAPPSRAVAALLAAEPAPPLAESAVAAYYAAHRKDFLVPVRVELRSIRSDDRATVERARREIRAGSDFATVARRLSSDSTAERGGEQGSFSRDELPPDLAKVVFALAPGELSGIVPTGDGFQLFQVTAKLPEHERPLAEVREEILRRLGGARADRAYARLVSEARSRYAVQVFDRNLPFVYHGEFPVSRPYENR